MGTTLGKPRNKALENPQDHGEENHEESSFTCEICIEPTLASKKFKNANSSCRHPFCQDCIAKYIEAKVQDTTAKIECPEPSCPHQLDPLVCRHMISAKLFSTWCDILCEDCLLGCDRSYCPNRNCLALVLNECRSRNNNVLKKCKCPNCKHDFCFRCQTVWHAGYECEEREQIMERSDVLFGQLVERKKWTRCPGCGHCVERLLGCSIVKCRCKTEFCYNCGKKFTGNGCGCKHGLGNLITNVSLYIMYIVVVFLFVIIWLGMHSVSLNGTNNG